MGLSKSRTITLVVAIATLTSNVLSSILFSQFPDDLYHLASNFGWYLHFANILSVFGFVGALRQHALSIAIFSNYLIIDTILCAIPRFIILTCLHQLSGSFCAPSSSSIETTYYAYDQQQIDPLSAGRLPDLSSPSFEPSALESITAGWSEEGCNRILSLAQLTLAAGCVAATLLQFVGALYVREYARSLWAKEVVEEEEIYRAALVSERVVLDEEDVEKR